MSTKLSYAEVSDKSDSDEYNCSNVLLVEMSEETWKGRDVKEKGMEVIGR